jgi:hypothetical protein
LVTVGIKPEEMKRKKDKSLYVIPLTSSLAASKPSYDSESHTKKENKINGMNIIIYPFQ